MTYRSGAIYNWLLNNLREQREKFATISNLIGKNKSVLDLPCGTGFLTRFLHSSVDYEGWDLNGKFLKKLVLDQRKGRVPSTKINLRQKDIFDFHDYPKEKKDVIVFCDVLHHVCPKHEELVENAKNHAKKIIICEPYSIRPEDVNARSKIFQLFINLGKFFPERLFKITDKFFLDNDGINTYEERNLWKHDEESLKLLYKDMGFNKIYSLMDDYIGVWEE